MTNKVLIIIDAQEDFTRGALRNEEAIAALPKLQEIVEYAKENNIATLYTMDTHGEDYLNTQEGKNLPVPHCIFMTEGWKICPEAGTNINPAHVIKKNSFGTTSWNKLALYDDNTEIWMCGFCTDICVSANFQIIKALYPERKITVIEDACAGVTPTSHKAALKVIQACQGRVVKWDKLKKETNNEA